MNYTYITLTILLLPTILYPAAEETKLAKRFNPKAMSEMGLELISLLRNQEDFDSEDDAQQVLNQLHTEIESQAHRYYKTSKFKKAITGLMFITPLYQDEKKEKESTIMLAECLAARALKEKNSFMFDFALNFFLKTGLDQNILYNDQKQETTVDLALACNDYDIMLCNYIRPVNDILKKNDTSSITVHLDGKLEMLKPILERSIENTPFTVGTLNREHKSPAPLIGLVHRDFLFNSWRRRKELLKPFQYLKPLDHVVNYWKEKIDPRKLNIVAAWCSSNSPCSESSKRTLKTNIPLKSIIDTALTVNPNTHLYLAQEKPHRYIIQSVFDTMSEEDQYKNRYSVIPDEYEKYVTDIAPDGQEPHGAFEDTLALLQLAICISCDKTPIPHMSGNVPGGQCIMIIPSKNQDGTSNRDWLWTEGDPEGFKRDGEPTIWYSPDIFRIFELNLSDKQELAHVAALLKQWHTARRLANH